MMMNFLEFQHATRFSKSIGLWHLHYNIAKGHTSTLSPCLGHRSWFFFHSSRSLVSTGKTTKIPFILKNGLNESTNLNLCGVNLPHWGWLDAPALLEASAAFKWFTPLSQWYWLFLHLPRSGVFIACLGTQMSQSLCSPCRQVLQW